MTFFSGVYGTCIGAINKFGTEEKSLIGLSGIFIGIGEILGWFKKKKVFALNQFVIEILNVLHLSVLEFLFPCFLKKNFYLFIYLFMAVLRLRFCARAFSSCGRRGPLFIAVRGPLTIAASLVVQHRLQTRRLSSCGSRV